MQRTLAQKRSEYILDRMKVPQNEQKEFVTLVQGLPSMILQNGLGHSLAFLLAKASNDQNDKHMSAFRIIAGWLTEQSVVPDETPQGVMRALAKMNQGRYLTGQTETLRLLEWVKRYAKAGLFA